MATMELDPLFVKALGFLRSKNKESAEQLRELLDDVIAGSGKSKLDKSSSFSGIKGAEDRGLQKTKRGGQSSPLSKADKSRRDVEKRTADRAKLDTSDSDSSAPTKKSKLVERPQRQAAKAIPIIDDDDDTDEDSDDSNHDSDKEDTAEAGGSTDADDFALELGLACVVCKKMDVAAGNNLIECQECHSLYHQQCHKPAATDADPNDPRLVWYCARCARNMKRQASKKPKSLPTSGRDAKGFDKSDESAMNLFKRSASEPKTVSSSGTSKQPFTGLAGMAANLTGRPPAGNNKPPKTPVPAGISQRSSSRSSTSSPVSKSAPSASKQYSSAAGSSSKSSGSSSKGGNSGKAMSQTQTASAMKRLHMMKKKASKR